MAISDAEALNRRTVLKGLGGAAALGGGALLARPALAEASVTDTFYDKGGAVFNVKAYGATGNGSTDDTASIKAAISACVAAVGGTVFFPQGTYNISSTLTLSTLGVHLVGAGRHATVIQASSGFRTGDMIKFEGTEYCSVESMTLSGGSTFRTSGAAIRSYGPDAITPNDSVAAAHHIRDVNLYNQFVGILIDGPGFVNYVDDAYIYPIAPGGYGIHINATGVTGASQFITNVLVNGGTTVAANQPAAAIRVQHTGDYTLRSFSSILCGIGLLIDPSDQNPGYGVQAGFHTDCLWDTMGNRGVDVIPASGVEVKALNFVNCWASGARGAEGMRLTGSVRGAQLVGCRFIANAGHGFFCEGNGSTTQSIFVDSSEASANNASNSGKAGFAFQNTSEFAVRNCHASHFWGGLEQAYGVRVLGGCDNYLLTGNVLRGNTTNLDAGTGANKVVANNLTT